MADRSSIEWTDATWNPIRGCTRVSPGCKHCWAERETARWSWGKGFAGRTPAGPRWTNRVALLPEQLTKVLSWKKPRRIFVCSTSDLFHEALSFEEIAAVWGVMAACPQHTFQVLTKRSSRMLEWFRWLSEQPHPTGLRGYPLTVDVLAHHAANYGIAARAQRVSWPLPNVWIGVSAEDQERADERIPDLLACPAVVRWVSAEPLLGSLSLRSWLRSGTTWHLRASVLGMLRNRSFDGLQHADGRAMTRREAEHSLYQLAEKGVRYIPVDGGCEEFTSQEGCPGHRRPRLDWVVTGGESCLSPAQARPCNPAWVRRIRDECLEADVPFFFKQWGTRCEYDQLPEEVLVRLDASGDILFTDPPPKQPLAFAKAVTGHQLDGQVHRAFPDPGGATCALPL